MENKYKADDRGSFAGGGEAADTGVKAKAKTGRIFMRVGLVLIAAALLLALYNVYDNYRAGRSVDKVLDAMPELVQASTPDPSLVQEFAYPDYVLYPEMPMPTVNIDGDLYIGVLSIPTLDKEFPVMSEWSYSNLRIAPCRYAGSAYMKGFVICAHNYTRHFGGMRRLQAGDPVTFTDIDGNVFSYKVEQLEQVDPDNAEYMLADDWDLTLFTCTLGGQFRTAVRCVLDANDSMDLVQM